MSGAINHPVISTHFLLSTYFLTAQTYKRMHVLNNVSLWYFMLSPV